jgi:hypothetical protein
VQYSKKITNGVQAVEYSLICSLTVDATQKESNKKERKRSIYFFRTKMFTSMEYYS